MPRRHATIIQADVARAVRAARQAGAAEVELRTGDGSVILIRIAPSTAPADGADQVVLDTEGKIIL